MSRKMGIIFSLGLFTLLATALLCFPASVMAEDVPPPEAPAQPESIAPGQPVDAGGSGMADDSACSGGSEQAPMQQLEIIASSSLGDPWFAVGAVTYSFTAADCNPTLGGAQPCTYPIQAAITFISTNGLIPTDRTVHVEASPPGYAETVIIDGSLPYLASLKTLAGAGSSGAYSTAPKTTLTGKVIIQNMPGGFTLSGFDITNGDSNTAVSSVTTGGVLKFQDLVIANTSTGQGMTVSNHAGSIEIRNVQVTNAGDESMLLNSSGNITILSSGIAHSFGGNTDEANLWAYSDNGSILINGFTTRDSHGQGMLLSAKKGVTILNASAISNGDGTPGNSIGYGILISQTSGTVRLENIISRYNDEDGIRIFNSGPVNLIDILTENNQRNGVMVDTCYWSGSACTGASSGTVTIKGLRTTGHMQTGLYIDARSSLLVEDLYSSGNQQGAELYLRGSGTATLNRLDIRSNFIYGLYSDIQGSIKGDHLEVQYHNGGSAIFGASLHATGAVTLTNKYGNNAFYTNKGTGLEVITNGAIQITDLDAGSNTLYGATLKITGGSGSVTLKEVDASDNGSGGLWVTSNGSITLDSASATSNNDVADAFGVFLDNSGAGASGSVTVTNSLLTNTFHYNKANGLTILSNRSISVKGISANYNDGLGMVLVNTTGSGAISIIDIQAYDNGLGGLQATARGNLTLTGGYATENDTFGAELVTEGSGNVTINQFETNNNDNGHGMSVNAAGSIIITDLSSSNNAGVGSNGVFLDNSSVVKPVTIKKKTFYANYFNNHLNGSGIEIHSLGAITLDGISVYGNGAYGVLLDNPSSKGSLVMKNFAVYTNQYDNLLLISQGGVSLTNGYLNYSGVGYGAQIEIHTGKGNATFSGVGFDNNLVQGLLLTSAGSVTLTNCYASGNVSQYGARINNTYGTGGVTIKGSASNTSTFNGNTKQGLYIESKGAVTLAYLSVNGATTTGGAYIRNDNSSGNIAITNSNFSDNLGGVGLQVLTKGSITHTNGSIQSNGGAGISLDNTASALTKKTVTLTGLMVSNNGDGGYVINASGNVTLTNCTGSQNQNDQQGLIVNSGGGVTIQGTGGDYSKFESNTNDGILINAAGPVTFKNVEVNSNAHTTLDEGYGAYINTTSGGVSLTNVWAESNDESGVYILCPGNVTIQNLTSQYSLTGYGVYIESQGSVTVTDITAYQNKMTGLQVTALKDIQITNINTRHNGNSATHTGSGAVLNNSSGNVKLLTKGGYLNVFDHNKASGLLVNTSGSLTIQNSQFNNNYAVNSSLLAGGAVNISASAFEESDTAGGLQVMAGGAASLTDVAFRYNMMEGLYLDTTSGSGSVNLTRLEVHGNLKTAVEVFTAGSITVNTVNITSHSSAGSYGLNLTNTASLSSAGVSLLGSYGTNTLSSCYVACVAITTNGPVSLAKVSVHSTSSSNGITIFNSGGSGDVTITNVTVDNSNKWGVSITTRGKVSANQVALEDNGIGGMYVDNTAGTLHRDVLISQGEFMNNYGHGLLIETDGNIVIKTITSSDNSSGGSGLYVDSTGGSGTVQILDTYGKSAFINNSGSGVYILSNGGITIKNADADDNDQHGIYLESEAGISISGGEIKRNRYHGIFASAKAGITIQNVIDRWNGRTGSGYRGIEIVSHGTDALIKNSVVTGNEAGGIFATMSGGTLTLQGVYYYGNNTDEHAGVYNLVSDNAPVILP